MRVLSRPPEVVLRTGGRQRAVSLASALLGGLALLTSPAAAQNPWQPYSVEAVGINPLAANTGTSQLVLSFMLSDRSVNGSGIVSHNGNYSLQAGYSLIYPNLPLMLGSPTMQHLDICNGTNTANGSYAVSIPGITTETVAASAANPGARGNPGDPNSPYNYTAAHVVAPFKNNTVGRGVMWHVIKPTGTGSPTGDFTSTTASTYLSCDKYFIRPDLLGGETVPEGNAAACATPDGQSLMATTIVQNNGTPSVRLAIALYQLRGGYTPDGANHFWRNGSGYQFLGTQDSASVLSLALLDIPGYVRFDPFDWNGNVAVCVTRNIGDAVGTTAMADGHQETLIAWFAIFSKKRGVLLTHLRLGYDAQGNLRAYKDNHAESVNFRRTDSTVPVWVSAPTLIPANRASEYPAPDATGNSRGLNLKLGIDGRAHLVYLGAGGTGRAYEELLSWGDGINPGGRYVYYYPEYNAAYTDQHYRYVAGAFPSFQFGNLKDQVAPIYYAFGQPIFDSTLSNQGTQVGLRPVRLPVYRQALCANGTLFEGDSLADETTNPFVDAAEHATVCRVPLDWRGIARKMPVGFIEGPPPYPNEHLTRQGVGTDGQLHPVYSGTPPASFLKTTYQVGSGQSQVRDFTTETGTSLNVKIGTTFVMGPTLDMNANYKQSSALRTEMTSTYDTTVEQSASVLAQKDTGNNVTGYRIEKTGTLLSRWVAAGMYRFSVLDPASNEVPGSDTYRLVMGIVPGLTGNHALVADTFDLNTTSAIPGAVRPGDISSYGTDFFGGDWNTLIGELVSQDDDTPLYVGTTWTRTSNLTSQSRNSKSETRTTGLTNDTSYLIGLSITATIPLVGDLTGEITVGQSYSSQQTTAFSANDYVFLATDMADWPNFSRVRGFTYASLTFQTLLLAPDGRWLNELLTHLHGGGSDGSQTERNANLLNQLLPGAGIFKITYRMDSGSGSLTTPGDWPSVMLDTTTDP